MRLELIDDWRDAWRFWSVRLMAVAMTLAALPETFLQMYALIPADLQEMLPSRTALVWGAVSLAFVARLVKQPSIPAPPAAEEPADAE